jgi:hypothetical protein
MTALSLAMTGCFDFESVSEVTKFRVLAVSAEPPEIRPGEGTTLSVLWADPAGGGREVQFAWMGCSGIVHASDGIATCDLLVPPVVRTAEQGGDTLEIPETPPDLLDGAPEGGAIKATFIVLMCAGGELPSAGEYDSLRDTKVISDLCRGGDGLSAYKTVTISNAEDPQTNPTIEHFELDGETLAPADEGGLGRARCEEEEKCKVKVEAALFMTEASIQEYIVYEFGEPVTLEDTVFVSWFSTGGEFTKSRSGEECEKEDMTVGNPCRIGAPDDPTGPFEVTWKPEEPGTYTLFAVARDMRGGVSWETYEIEVEGFSP